MYFLQIYEDILQFNLSRLHFKKVKYFLVYLASIFPPLSTSCTQHVPIDLILTVILLASFLWNKHHLSLFQMSRVLKATLKKTNLKKQWLHVTFYLTYLHSSGPGILHWHPEWQNEITKMSSCSLLDFYRSSTVCHVIIIGCFSLYHRSTLWTHHAALISCCSRKVIIVIVLGYTISIHPLTTYPFYAFHSRQSHSRILWEASAGKVEGMQFSQILSSPRIVLRCPLSSTGLKEVICTFNFLNNTT